MARLVAVTGVTGFIGSALIPILIARGWRIRALVRRNVELPGTELIQGDLRNPDVLERLLEGTEAVVHCAGRVRGARGRDFQIDNVEGTSRLAHMAAASRHPPRFLYISSLAAREPELSWYAASKRQAEQALAEHEGLLPYTVFRPTAVYGPGDEELRPLFTAMRYGLLPVPANACDARVTLIYIDDLIQAILHWLDTDAPNKGPYELHDGMDGGYTWSTIREIGERTFDRRIRLLSIPKTALRLVAHGNLWLARILGYDPMLTPGKVRELCWPDWHCDNSTIFHDLGWQPQFGLEDFLRHAPATLTAK